MRKKIEELRNKEDGFTLVELLAVIVILGIILAIAVPAVGSIISDSEQKAKAAEEELVIDAARLYFTASGETEDSANVDITTLLKDGYLESKPKEMEATTSINRSKAETGGYTYSIDGKVVVEESAGGDGT